MVLFHRTYTLQFWHQPITTEEEIMFGKFFASVLQVTVIYREKLCAQQVPLCEEQIELKK